MNLRNALQTGNTNWCECCVALYYVTIGLLWREAERAFRRSSGEGHPLNRVKLLGAEGHRSFHVGGVGVGGYLMGGGGNGGDGGRLWCQRWRGGLLLLQLPCVPKASSNKTEVWC